MLGKLSIHLLIIEKVVGIAWSWENTEESSSSLSVLSAKHRLLHMLRDAPIHYRSSLKLAADTAGWL